MNSLFPISPRRLVLCGALSVVLLFALAFFDKNINPEAEMPGFISFVGSVLILVALTSIQFRRRLIKREQTVRWLTESFIGYNALIIFLKFAVGVSLVYGGVLHGNFFLPIIGLHSLIGMVLALYILYALIFFFISRCYKIKINALLTAEEHKKLRLITLWPHVTGSTLFLIATLFVFTGGMTAIPLFVLGGAGAVAYLYGIFFSGYGFAILLVIFLAGALCFFSFHVTSRHVLETKQPYHFLELYKDGRDAIIFFHVTWFFYFIILNLYWPIITLVFLSPVAF